MKTLFRTRAIALALCLAMVIGFFPGPITAFSVGTDSNNGSVVGAVGVIGAESLLLATAPAGESGHEVINPVDPAALPAKVVVVETFEGTDNTWYKLDAAPGYTWPAEYDTYRWTYAYSIDITDPNGTTGIFDANGNAVSSLIMPMYNKIKLNADSSLIGTVKYQWQICYDVEKDLWANIYNETDKDLTISLGLVAMVLQNDKAYVRCTSTSGAKVAVSDPVTVTVDFTVPESPSDPDPTVPSETETQQYANITVDGEETTETTIEYDNCTKYNQPIENGTKKLGVNTSLEGELTYSWQARAEGAADGEWEELGTGSTFEISRYELNGYFAAASVGYSAFMRVVVTCGETVIESAELVITINERNPELYEGTVIESDVTTSSGENVTVSVSGNVPETATLTLSDASDTTTIPDVDSSEIALALDVTITQDGAQWQPAAGETVAVSIPVEQLGLQNGDYFAVYHIHDGETEILGPFRCEDGYATFVIDGFSVVAISTNYGAAIGGVAEFAGSSVILDVSPVSFAGETVWVKDANLPAKVVIKNYVFDDYLGKLFYEIDAAPGYTWPEEYAELHWCYSDALKNINIGGSMGVFDENGEPVSFVELPLSAKPTYTVQTSLTGGVKYQWQVCYDVQNYLWMDITGQTDASITLSYALLASVLDENGMCAVRCVVSNAVKTQEGYPLVIAIVEDSAEEETPVEDYVKVTVNGEETDSAELADQAYYWDSETQTEVTIEAGVLNLSAVTSLSGDDVTYQWQALSGTEWVELSCGKEYQLTFSDLMFAGAYSGSTAYIRVIVTKGETVVEGEQLTITIVETETAQYALATGEEGSGCASSSSDGEADTTAEEGSDTNTVLVTVQFVMGDNTVPIENGLFTYNVPYNGNVTDTIIIPQVQGYAAYLEDDRTTACSGTYELSETNVTENKTITFRFWPAEVPYKVIYMQQNVSDDGYTAVRTDELTGLTGSEPEVENVSYEGFVMVWCSTDKIASDGSTVIEVKYDRLYFKMLFDLDGGYGVQPVYARYGTPVTVNNPSKAGYNFMGWNALNGPYNTSDDEDTADIGAFTNILIPAEHTNYKAIWKASDAAKVTVVIWGQKADNSDDLTDPNSYAYMSETEDGDDLTNLYFNAKPGTTVTYNPTTGGYICGYTEEHKHGTGDCALTCTKQEHTHEENCSTLICQETGHTEAEGHTDACLTCGGLQSHSISCYESSRGALSTSAVTDYGILFGLNYAEKTAGGLYKLQVFSSTSYYYKFGDQYYQVTGANDSTTVSLKDNCGHTNLHDAHTDACYGCHIHSSSCYAPCSQEEHTHTDACYAGCTKEEHTHSESCKLTVPMNSNLWVFDHATTVTVAADGSSTLNVYYRRTQFTITFHYNRSGGSYQSTSTITDLWGADIGARFLDVNKAASGNLWSEDSDGSDPWTSYLQIMPKRNIDYYCRYTSTNEQSAEYYTQKLDGTYKLEYTVTAYYDSTLSISKEDFYEMEGFTYSHGTDGEGGSMPSPGSYKDFHGAKFYYTRNSYNLVFDNYGTTFKNESVLYEASLAGYAADSYKVPDSLAPVYYQPGSVTFAGWYAAPQTPGDFNFDSVQSFDFANSTMPASDLKLYAWWKPVSHQVTFYYDYAAFEAGNIYAVDGEEQTFPIPHGSRIQDPYTPPKDPTSNYYSFVGWAYRDANGTEVLWDFDNSTVTEDIELYGKWNSTTPADYEVRFVTVIDGKEVEIADPITGSALGGTLKTFDAKFNEELYPGYQDRYYPRDMSHSITINLEDLSQNTFTFYYDYVEYTSYTVKYLEKETGIPMSEIDSAYPVQKTIENNTHAMVTETFVAIPGYLPDAYQKVCKIDPDGTNEIIFYYTKDNENGLWTVHYWLENLDGSYSEAIDMLFTGTAKNGATVTAPTDTVIENYYYYAAHKENVSTGTVSIDKVTHLHMYYNRTVHDYTVQYLEAGTNKVLAPEKVKEDLKWGTLVTERADDENVEVDFNIYQVYGDAEKTMEISVDESKNVITFYYTEKRITINYAVVGPDGTVDFDGVADFGKVEPNNESLQILSGKASGSNATAGNVFKFVGWYDNAACTGTPISTSATYVPAKAEDALWVDGTTYYAKFEYNLTSLTIKKEGWENVDPNQTFIFNIKGDGLDMNVTVHGNGSVTIDGLTVGQQYTITEITDWSWRYGFSEWEHQANADSNTVTSGTTNGATITLGLNGTITFTNERSIFQWLDGDSWCDNWFGPAKNTTN